MKKELNYPLKNISWIKIGGEVREYICTETNDEFNEVIKEKILKGEEYKILGWGANTLISDNKIDLCVIKNLSNSFEFQGKVENALMDDEINGLEQQKEIDSRFSASTQMGTFRGIEFKDLDYSESDKENVLIKLSSGMPLPQVINLTISKGLTGLQWFSGIPGQLGSCVYNNIHGGTHLLSEFIDSVMVIDKDGNLKKYSNSDLQFGYDNSILHKTNEVITEINLKLKLGDKQKAEYTAKEWAKRKISQPKNSLGSIFKNLIKEDQIRLNFPTPSIGYLVEHKLNLSGFRIGDAKIAETSNNFIVNMGNCTSSDYLSVIKKIKVEAFNQFGITLIPEIFFLGFTKEELEGII